MSKNKIIFFFLLFFPGFGFANPEIAPYVLDGELALFVPVLKTGSGDLLQLIKKFTGAEYEKSISLLRARLRDRLGVSILNPHGAASIGIDENGAVAYVHLAPKKGYMIFTIKNKNLLTSYLDRLPVPMPYRIEGNFIIFSASPEILEFYRFKGLQNTSEFKQIAKALSFRWDQNFVWMTANYLNERKSSLKLHPFPEGDRIGGIFSINYDDITLDLYTVYKDPQVQSALRKSMVPYKTQRINFLDYEDGTAALIGQTYLDTSAFIDAIGAIDKADELGVKNLLNKFEQAGINLKDGFFRYMGGRNSYIVRAFDIQTKNIDVTLISPVVSQDKVEQFFVNTVNLAHKNGKKIKGKSLFTRNFYGWDTGDFVVWFGLAEGHAIITTSEDSLNKLVHNIYENRKGFLSQVPPAFQRISKTIYGGRFYINAAQVLQTVRSPFFPLPYDFMVALESIEWYFYLEEVDAKIGRHDSISINFFKK
ncbi:hypothetical protein SAMN02745150_00134 [Brevinema andersonii]|uniref:Uncharacterized protein n=2 Tax=Brevinema andersonii TaxID=34097 RepID=A0A1I1D4K4_BREAD|nr:hypothetical protein SAMN02745150_00134 [Brevinema andersonii]